MQDPTTREIDKKDAKQFMVNQTAIVLERDQILLSPFDDMVWKQMMDYQVIRISQNGKPIYTSENEHALDAFMLTILGFTLEFPDITKILEEIRIARKMNVSKQSASKDKLSEKVFGDIPDVFNKSHNKREVEVRDDPNWHLNKVALGYKGQNSTNRWGRRGSNTKSPFKRAKI